MYFYSKMKYPILIICWCFSSLAYSQHVQDYLGHHFDKNWIVEKGISRITQTVFYFDDKGKPKLDWKFNYHYNDNGQFLNSKKERIVEERVLDTLNVYSFLRKKRGHKKTVIYDASNRPQKMFANYSESIYRYNEDGRLIEIRTDHKGYGSIDQILLVGYDEKGREIKYEKQSVIFNDGVSGGFQLRGTSFTKMEYDSGEFPSKVLFYESAIEEGNLSRDLVFQYNDDLLTIVRVFEYPEGKREPLGFIRYRYKLKK